MREEATTGAGAVWYRKIVAFKYRFCVQGPTTLHTLFLCLALFAATSSQNAGSEEFYAVKEVPHGTLQPITYLSKTTGKERRYYVYLPPAYAENTSQRYPILFLLHGANCDERSWPYAGNVKEIMDNLLAEKKAVPMIVVSPNGYASKPGEAQPDITSRKSPPDFNAMFATFEEEFSSDLLPDVERRFRTIPDRSHRALAGFSMGGLQTMSLGLDHLQLFSYLGGFSGCGGAFNAPINLKTDHRGAMRNAKKFNAKMNLLFLTEGSNEPGFILESVKRYRAALNAAGIKYSFYESPGTTHDYPTWRRSLHEFAPLLFPDLRDVVVKPLPSPAVAFGQPIHPASDDKKLFPDAPAGFDDVRKDIPHGKLEHTTWYSSTVGKARNMLVYTPPGYSALKKYPTLYLLHGIGANEYQWGWAGKPDVVLDNLIAEGKAAPMVVVMPNGCAQMDDEPKGDKYASAPAYATFEQDLLVDLIPTIEKSYSVSTKAEDRAIAGLSMGGGQSLDFGFAHMDVFKSIGGFSSAPNTYQPDRLVPDVDKAKKLRLVYVSAGTKDGLFGISQRTHQYLRDHDIPHIWNVDGHGHDRDTWSYNLYYFLQKVFR
ncbi:esterase [Fimbriimonas ginsengisoli Gsoil 348]|uniref:Esterase n=1 Tax=Fimbriimonas ginsengisoli Gsoil 348 TaxID=661478 RepID=A0A068NW37_FIMGI|nr:esterase [Fimbriimonas ginsengisoli Gsoil 348]